MEINKLRKTVDSIDSQVLKLLNQRAKVILGIGKATIKKLVKEGVFQYELFDKEVQEGLKAGDQDIVRVLKIRLLLLKKGILISCLLNQKERIQ